MKVHMVNGPSLLQGVLIVFGCFLANAACEPVGLEGLPCSSGPCASGLVCLDGVCQQPPPPSTSEACVEDADCIWKGTSDGRACENGTCVFAACSFDVQCGERVCDAGRCADEKLCLDDGDCPEAQDCREGACRTPCGADEECPVFGGFLQTCVEGTCRQRCFGDLTCLGDICENNVCVEPACSDDADCATDGDFFCSDGRCVAFTPCVIDEDCFDPDFACNPFGRCVERPLCRVDGDCGQGLCINRHCRDAVACADTNTCSAGEECLAGRCVDAPECRSSSLCAPPAVCDAGRCAMPRTDASLVVRGVVQSRVALVGDTVPVAAQAFGADGFPVRAEYRWLDAEGVGPRAAVTCLAPGVRVPAVEVWQEGERVETVTLPSVTCVEAAGDLVVLVIDGATGEPVSEAEVLDGFGVVGRTDEHGVFAFAVFDGGDVGVRSADGRGALLSGAQPGRVSLALPVAVSSMGGGARAAGVRVRVRGNGDEDDPVGVSFALSGTSNPRHAQLGRLFGPPFRGTVDVPVLGSVGVDLPAVVMLDAILPVVGQQEVKDIAWVQADAGPAQILAYESRYPQDRLLELVLNADPVETVLDIVAGAEGMDARLAGAGILAELPLVSDGDTTDGVDDVDGDGDIAELVPDWLAFQETEVVPTAPPTERVGLRASIPPEGARARMFAICGVELPAQFMPLGVGVVFGTASSTTSATMSVGEQMKVMAAPAALDGHPRACALHAIFDDASAESTAIVHLSAFSPSIPMSRLLAPPTGTFLLPGVPEPEQTTLVLPATSGADAVNVEVLDAEGNLWTVTAQARAALPLPTWFAPITIEETRTLVLGAPLDEEISRGPLRALEDVALAVAVARN